jgi:hypothetical protein
MSGSSSTISSFSQSSMTIKTLIVYVEYNILNASKFNMLCHIAQVDHARNIPKYQEASLSPLNHPNQTKMMILSSI